jgi:hypothetical protein
MATIDQIKQEIADIRTTIGILENDVKQIINQQLDTNIAIDAATTAGNAAEVSRLKAVARDLRSELNSVNEQIAQQNSRLGALGAQLQQAEQAAQPPTSVASSADTTRAAQTARDDGASPSNPVPPQQVETPDGRIVEKTTAGPTNAVPPPTTENGDTDSGTNAATVTLTNSQSASDPPASGPLPLPPSSTSQNPSQRAEFNQLQGSGAVPGATPVNNGKQGGVGARSDDAAGVNGTAAVRNRLDELYGGASNAIVAQDNVLDQYASYTYSLSWYVMDPETYKKLMKSSQKTLNGYYLLVQSGGADVSTQTPTSAANVGTGRSPFFPLDFYLDNFELNTTYSSTPGTGGAAQFKDVSFTVTEPNGITLLSNLLNAVKDLYETKNVTKPGTPVNYAAAQYCMVVRFYGYDINGNLVQPIARRTGSTDNRAAIEKFIPFIITAIDWRVANKLVEYTIKGASPGTITGFSTNRGSIPQNFQFQGSTVKDILVGTVVQQTASQAAGDETRNGVPIQSSPPGSNTVQDPQQRAQALLEAGQ